MKTIGSTTTGQMIVELTIDEWRALVTNTLIDPLNLNLREMRKGRGLSQQELADRAGISRNYVSMLERGEADNVSISVYRRLVAELSK